MNLQSSGLFAFTQIAFHFALTGSLEIMKNQKKSSSLKKLNEHQEKLMRELVEKKAGLEVLLIGMCSDPKFESRIGDIVQAQRQVDMLTYMVSSIIFDVA